MATSFIVKSNFCTDTYDVNVLWRKSSTLNFYSDIAKFERNEGFLLYGPIINDFKRKVFFNFSKESAENILCKTPSYDLHYLFRTFSGNQKFHSLGCICKENFKCSFRMTVTVSLRKEIAKRKLSFRFRCTSYSLTSNIT